MLATTQALPTFFWGDSDCFFCKTQKQTALHASPKLKRLEVETIVDPYRDIFLNIFWHNLLSLLSFSDLYCAPPLTAVVEYTFVIEGTKNPQSVTGLGVIKQTAELELIEMQSSLQLRAQLKMQAWQCL